MEQISEERFKELCKKEGCYCPDFYKVMRDVANTPTYLRVYFREQGRQGAIREILKRRLSIFGQNQRV